MGPGICQVWSITRRCRVLRSVRGNQTMQQPKVKAALAVSAILSGLVIQGCHKPAQDTAPQAAVPVPVSIMTAQISSMNKSLPVVGQLQSDNQVNLTSKVAGKVNKLLVT